MEGVKLPVAPQRRLAGAPRRALERADPALVAWIALALLLVLAGAFLYRETRGTSFWVDEWDWVLGRRGSSLGTFLRPHNSHLSLVPILVYKLLFATAGLGDYRPYRAIVILAHLGCVLLVFAYARRRIGAPAALVPATLILFLGPGWQNILWPFQMAWLFSLGAGVGALLALDRRDRRGELAACALLVVAVASSSIGVAIAAGAAVEVAWERRRVREAWVVAVPLVLYAVWALGYQQATLTRHNLVLAVQWAADAASGATAALLGLAGQPSTNDVGTLLTFGAPLALAAAGLLGWRLTRLGRLPVRVAALLVMLAVFWLLAAVGRADITHGYDSRYLYVSGLLIALVAAEAWRGARVRPWAGIALAVVTLAAVSSNLGAFRDAGRMLRDQAQLLAGDLGALDLVKGEVPADYVAGHFPAWPFVVLRAGPYYAAERALGGTPGAGASLLPGLPEDARIAADEELTVAHGVTLAPASRRPALGPAPPLDAAAGGTAHTAGSCVHFAGAFTGAAGAPTIALTVPGAGVLVSATGAPAAVSIRRFALTPQALGTLPAGAPSLLRIGADRSPAPWHLQLSGSGRITVCGLAAR